MGVQSMSMCHNDKNSKNMNIRFTIRMDPKTEEILETLQKMTLLSKAGIFRLALISFYNQNVDQESQINQLDGIMTRRLNNVK